MQWRKEDKLTFLIHVYGGRYLETRPTPNTRVTESSPAMFSAELCKRANERESQRKESERLALKNKEVRRKVQKYDRRRGGRTKVRALVGGKAEGESYLQASGGGRGVTGILKHTERQAEQAAKTSARLELLLNEEAG